MKYNANVAISAPSADKTPYKIFKGIAAGAKIPTAVPARRESTVNITVTAITLPENNLSYTAPDRRPVKGRLPSPISPSETKSDTGAYNLFFQYTLFCRKRKTFGRETRLFHENIMQKRFTFRPEMWYNIIVRRDRIRTCNG